MSERPYPRDGQESGNEPVRLFCLPYAGGSTGIFHKWEEGLPGFVDVCPLELPGRGTRFGESPHTHLDPLVEDLMETIIQRLDRPFALFGYSFGSLLAFEISRRLESEYGQPPACLFVAAFRPPDSDPPANPASSLSDEEFRRRLEALNGTPRELFESAELMELMLPIVKADFAVADTYVYTCRTPLSCPIVALGSVNDPEVSMTALKAWEGHTVSSFSVYEMPGDHFFVHTQRGTLLRNISSELIAHGPTREGSSQ